MATIEQKRLPTETVDVAALKPHPRNYKSHPEDQLAHIAESLREHGQYRNVVVARDGTILAGHGVVEAAKSIGLGQIEVVRIDADPNDPRAIKILTGDNEVGRLAEIDDSVLLAHLKGLAEIDALLGTGYTADSVAELARAVERGNAEAEAPPYFPTLDPETLVTEYCCPSCGYEWSGAARP